MSRARNIKPGVMENERLAECSPYARLLFVYMWMIADRAGRMEDRPKRIKALTLPYDNVDAEPLLQELHEAKFINRYEVDGERYIQIVNFEKHQTPHVKEKASTIPACVANQSTTVQEPDLNHASTGQEPDLHQTSTVQAPDNTDTSTELAPPDSLIVDSLIPDSLIHDSLIHDSLPASQCKAPSAPKRKSRIDPDMILPDAWRSDAELYWITCNRQDLRAEEQFFKFKNYHSAKGSLMLDWSAAWRTWYANATGFQNARASPSKSNIFDLTNQNYASGDL